MFCFRKTWNNLLPHIVKYLAVLDVKWNLPTSAQADISHLRSKYFTAKRFHLPERANFVAYLLYGRCAEGVLFSSVGWVLLFVGRTRRMTQYTHRKGAYANHIHAEREVVKPRFRQTKRTPRGCPFCLVETGGLEPLTPCMSSKYSNQLSYASVPIYYTHNATACQEHFRGLLFHMSKFDLNLIYC